MIRKRPALVVFAATGLLLLAAANATAQTGKKGLLPAGSAASPAPTTPPTTDEVKSTSDAEANIGRIASINNLASQIKDRISSAKGHAASGDFDAARKELAANDEALKAMGAKVDDLKASTLSKDDRSSLVTDAEKKLADMTVEQAKANEAVAAQSTQPPVDVKALSDAIKTRALSAPGFAHAGNFEKARELVGENVAALKDLQKKVDEIHAQVSAKRTPDAVVAASDKALAEAKASNEEADKKINDESANICGGGARFHPCFYVGAFLASGSWVTYSVGTYHGGKTGHTLLSTAIPAAGLRFPLDSRGRFSAEIGALSMVLSKDLSATSQRKGCREGSGSFEKLLPCEGEVSLTPVVAGYIGLTAGTPDIGLVTIMPMVGAATTSLDGSVRAYGGVAVGVVNFSKVFNWDKR